MAPQHKVCIPGFKTDGAAKQFKTFRGVDDELALTTGRYFSGN